MESNASAGLTTVRRHVAYTDGGPPAPFTASPPPPRKHESRVFAVQTEVVWPTITPDGELRGPPHLRLRWAFMPGQSGRVVGFRRRLGFGSAGDYGELIVNSCTNGEKAEHLEPGEYFYNFFTRTSLLGLFHSFSNDLQFSETIPSVANVLNSMKQAIEFTELRQKFVQVNTPPKEPEEPLEVWRREFVAGMASIDARCDAAAEFTKQWEAKRQQIETSARSKSDKKRRIEILDGMMREFREKFEV